MCFHHVFFLCGFLGKQNATSCTAADISMARSIRAPAEAIKTTAIRIFQLEENIRIVIEPVKKFGAGADGINGYGQTGVGVGTELDAGLVIDYVA